MNLINLAFLKLIELALVVFFANFDLISFMIYYSTIFLIVFTLYYLENKLSRKEILGEFFYG
jgi:hypothetical protein